MANSLRNLFAKKQKKCKGRNRATCKQAGKKCSWINGPKRTYCRKSAKRRRSSKSK